MSEYTPITSADIPPELRQVAERYAQKVQIANYMRPTAYGAFIDGALFAQGKYLEHKDKDGLKLKIDF